MGRSVVGDAAPSRWIRIGFLAVLLHDSKLLHSDIEKRKRGSRPLIGTVDARFRVLLYGNEARCEGDIEKRKRGSRPLIGTVDARFRSLLYGNEAGLYREAKAWLEAPAGQSTHGLGP